MKYCPEPVEALETRGEAWVVSGGVVDWRV